MHPERPNLLIAILMALPHELPIFVGATFNCELSHDYPGLLGKKAGRAHKHHGGNPTRLLCCHMQERIASTAQAYRLESLDTQVIEQSKHVECALLKGKHLRWVG